MNIKVAVRLCIALLGITSALYGGSSLNGIWTGKTSRGEAVSFEIEDGAIKSFTFGYSLRLDEPCVTEVGSQRKRPVLGGTATLLFPYTKAQFEQMKSQGETRIDPATVRLRVGEDGFEVTRDDSPDILVTLAGNAQADGSIAGDLTIAAKTCKGREKITWSATKEE